MATLKIGDIVNDNRYPGENIEVKFHSVKEANQNGYWILSKNPIWYEIHKDKNLIGYIVQKKIGRYQMDRKIALP